MPRRSDPPSWRELSPPCPGAPAVAQLCIYPCRDFPALAGPGVSCPVCVTDRRGWARGAVPGRLAASGHFPQLFLPPAWFSCQCTTLGK